jgi:hypothetical protein
MALATFYEGNTPGLWPAPYGFSSRSRPIFPHPHSGVFPDQVPLAGSAEFLKEQTGGYREQEAPVVQLVGTHRGCPKLKPQSNRGKRKPETFLSLHPRTLFLLKHLQLLPSTFQRSNSLTWIYLLFPANSSKETGAERLSNFPQGKWVLNL